MQEATHHEENLEDFSVIRHEEDIEDSQEFELDTGDYATRLEEILGPNEREEEEEEEDFLYQGEDSQETSGTYNEQLKSVLQGLDDDGAGIDVDEERQVEEQLEEKDVFVYQATPEVDVLSDHTPSAASLPLSTFRRGATSTVLNDSSPRNSLTKPFLHPNISRLRSFVPQQQNRMSSVSSLPNVSPSPSHFSAISRASSISNLRVASETKGEEHEHAREAFRWAVLRDIGRQLYMRKATSILGSYHGSPTVLAANGLICIGTDRGHVLVFDFKQHLRCICGTGTNDILESAGPVSALSLSHDHTYVAVGHAYGHINLYDISRPQTPARSVTPTSLAAVASGRKEGHIEGTQILSLGFVGTRHTAIVSADDNGLAFYHSLGKVLFVEASDTLRILGRYPVSEGEIDMPKKTIKSADPSSALAHGSDAIPSNPLRSRPWKPRKGSSILAMSSLPPGTTAHPTEAYNLVALLTPTKLVIVGLKPSPRTWFRRHREDAPGIPTGASKWRGCLAWFPSVDPGIELREGVSADHTANGEQTTKPRNKATRPVLAYSWDRSLYLLRLSEVRVKQTMQSTKNRGKTIVVDVGKLELEEVSRWSSESDYLAIQWLNIHQLLTLTATYLEVWDVRTSQRVERVLFNANSLLPCIDSGEIPQDGRIAHSMRVYKGKVFLLGRQELKVGTLLSWADHILAFVEDGDFLNAIETTRSYFLGTAPGNRMGLPDDPSALLSLVGRRMRDLMIASARYAFAEERMTDGTHVTPDGRGVDRTSLFEGLVTVCAEACIALEDLEFLFEDLFEEYDRACIVPIFLTQLEPFVLDGRLRSIPPRITQRLVGYHEERGALNDAERIIWHIDPGCLDVDQAITLCRSKGLYDALIYVYTRSMHDFVTPIVELLELVRQIQRHRKSQHLHLKAVEDPTIPATFHISLDSLVMDAYKIFTYLADVLSGLTYPSQIPMPPDEALHAKKDVYHFLFKGISYASVGADGRLMLTSDEEGGIEQTYPYVRLLLRFDAEAFLHAMDIAFEDSYFNEDPQDVDRLVITRILLEILSTPGLSSPDTTMLRIFIARNVPKYPQSIQMAPSTLQDILVGLAEDTDQSTREDRQLAAEYLLSIYTPHDSEKMIELFEDAHFFRILRTWHRQEHKWGPLVSTYLRDPDIDSSGIFHEVDEVLIIASRDSTGTLPVEVLIAIMEAIPQLLNSGITETAILIDKYAPNAHAQVLEKLGNNSPHQQFAYLRCLLEPSALPEEQYWADPTLRRLPPSRNLDQSSREQYLKLLCQFDSPGVLRCLGGLDDGFFNWDAVVSICEQNGVNEAVIWSLDKRGDIKGAFQKLERIGVRLASEIGNQLASESDADSEYDIQRQLDELKAVGNIGVQICQAHSAAGGAIGISTVEDMWFRLLSSQIETVQTVSSFCSFDASSEHPKVIQEQRSLETLRGLVQTTFTSLMALGSSPVLSFPRLFKRLVDSTSSSRSSSMSSYSEFRLILTGMLDSYRGEGDLLLITNRLIERDLFTTVEEFAKCRTRGTRVHGISCMVCKGAFQQNTPPQLSKESAVLPESLDAEDWLVQSTGFVYHRRCLPSVIPP